jgi:hypothetical protein
MSKNKYTKKQLEEAKKDFKKMEDEIAPFIKNRKFKQYSTEGRWCNASPNICQEYSA